MCRLSQSENMYVVNCCSLVETCEQKGIGLEHNATTLSNQPDGLDVSSDVWQGTSGTSRDVPAVGLEVRFGIRRAKEIPL